MTRQPISIGATANDRTGDPLRTAFQKTNSNFTELYDRVESLEGDSGGSIDRSWVDVSANVTYDVVEWNSGSTVEILSTATETYSLTTYDARSNSQYVYFVWDQTFIDDIWDGYNNPLGEGMNFELSFDSGVTWLAADTSGYSGGMFLYFSVPYENEGQYTFTYIQGMVVQIRFNRGSFPKVWFDLADSPFDANNIISVTMSAIANPRMNGANNTVLQATIFNPSISFTNILYNDNIGIGSVESTQATVFGNTSAINATELTMRMSSNTADAGRLYCNFDGGQTGYISVYWNAKLFTRV
jgi:hypothetical protein